MKMIKKYYKLVIILLVVSLLACSNSVLAESKIDTEAKAAWEKFKEKDNAPEEWDKIVEKFMSVTNNQMSMDEIPYEELLIMYGANSGDLSNMENEASYWMQHAHPNTWGGFQEEAREKLENIAQGGEQTGNTNEENIEEANKLRNEIIGLCANLDNKTEEELQDIMDKINKYKTTYNGVMDETMIGLHRSVNDKITQKGGEADNTIYEGQVGVIGGNDEGNGAGASTGLLGNTNASASHTPDDIIGGAQDFLNKGNSVTTINGDNLTKASSTLYNILLSIGILLSVGIGMYLGVKFMVSTAEDKAKVKEAMIPYIAGCIVIFSAFVIWKAVILLLGGIG